MQLTVKPLKQSEASRGLVALDAAAAEELGFDSGDYVRLVGEDEVVGRVWPGYPEDRGTGVVRVDGRIRSLLGVDIDDTVTVEPADVAEARLVTVSVDGEQDVEVSGEFDQFVRGRLEGTPLVEGQQVALDVGFGVGETGGQRLPLAVRRTEPDGVVVVTGSTTVRVRDQPLDAPGAIAADVDVAHLPSAATGGDDDRADDEADAGGEAAGTEPDAGDGSAGRADAPGDDPGDGEEADAGADASRFRRTVRQRLRENTLLLGVVVFVLLAAAVPLLAFVLADATRYGFGTWATAITGVVSVLGIGAGFLVQRSD